MSKQAHWETVYSEKSEDELSWHQATPSVSLELLDLAGLNKSMSAIDIGAGTSRLVDALLTRRLGDITLLDMSAAALEATRARLGAASASVRFTVCDVTSWQPSRCFDIWHDRAVFHFLVAPEERAAYIARLSESLKPGGHAVIATFALDGPEKCSGLPVMRYAPQTLAETLGADFDLIAQRHHLHHTPWGSAQSFQYSLFRKI